MLKDNLHQVQQNIKAACDRAHRNYSDVTLIAVSKTKPVEMLSEIYDEGIREFGEFGFTKYSSYIFCTS